MRFLPQWEPQLAQNAAFCANHKLSQWHAYHMTHTQLTQHAQLTQHSPNLHQTHASHLSVLSLLALSLSPPHRSRISPCSLFTADFLSLPFGLSTAGASLHWECFELIKSGGKSNGFNRERRCLGSEEVIAEVIAEVITVVFGGNFGCFLFLFVH